MPGWVRRFGGVVRGGPVSVTTSDEYRVVRRIFAVGVTPLSVFIENTGSNNALLRITSVVGGIEYVEVPENVLTAGDVYKVVLTGSYDYVNIYAKSGSAGNPTTLKISWSGVRV